MAEIIRRIVAFILSFSSLFSSFRLMFLPKRDLYPVENGEMRVMTFNLKYTYDNERMKNAAELIAWYYPDSIGLQECTYEWMVLLKNQLPDYGFIGLGRDTGNLLPGCGEMSAIMYRKDKYTVVDSGSFWLSDTPDTPSKSWDANHNRICTWAILKDKSTGKTFAHYNTHLDHQSSTAQKNGLALIISKIKDLDIPVMLTGDFNITENSGKLKALRDAGYSYTKEMASKVEKGNDITFHNYDPDNTTSPHVIDYIWVNSKVTSVSKYKIIEDRIDGKLVSDHYPVMADIKL